MPESENQEQSANSQNDKAVQTKTRKKTKKAEEFWKVRFNAKSSVNDEDQVTLGCNGVLLKIEREKDVILPQRFLEVADHTVSIQYVQKPGEKRKIAGKVQTFPYTKIGKSTRAEYLIMKKKGTSDTKRSMELDGSN